MPRPRGSRFWLLVVVLGFAGTVTAHAFHSGGAAECTGCHSMHSPSAPGGALLKQSDASSVCLSCHQSVNTSPVPQAGQAVGVYRLLAGAGYAKGGVTFSGAARGDVAGAPGGCRAATRHGERLRGVKKPATFPARHGSPDQLLDPGGRYRSPGLRHFPQLGQFPHGALEMSEPANSCIENHLQSIHAGLNRWPPSCTWAGGGAVLPGRTRQRGPPHVIPEDGMKSSRVGLALFAGALLLLGYGGSKPKAFHSGGVAECGGCHSMHAAKSSGGLLLVGTDQSSTCLSCHQHAGDTGPSSYHVSTAEARHAHRHGAAAADAGRRLRLAEEGLLVRGPQQPRSPRTARPTATTSSPSTRASRPTRPTRSRPAAARSRRRSSDARAATTRTAAHGA